jgi:hypothetical protein
MESDAGVWHEGEGRKLATSVLEEVAKRESAKEGAQTASKLSASLVMHIEPNLMGKEPEG